MLANAAPIGQSGKGCPFDGASALLRPAQDRLMGVPTKVILLADLAGLGQLGDVVSVRPGHARNLLYPKGLAERYTPEAHEHFAARKEELIRRNEETQRAREKLQSSLDGYLLQVVAQAGADGRLYGSLNVAGITRKLKEQGFEISRNQVTIPEPAPIKQTGSYDITIDVAPNLRATVKLNILSERDGD